VGSQLRDAVGQPDRQPRHLAAGRLAHLVWDALAQLEDLLGTREGGLAASVRATPRPEGLSNWCPSDFSSSRTWALMVCTAMSSRSAARAKPPSLVTTQK